MRLVVFTAHQDLEDTPFWSVLRAFPGVEALLILRRKRRRGPGAAWRSLRKNVQRYGLIYLPYRAIVGALEALSGESVPLPFHRPVDSEPPTEAWNVQDLNAPDVIQALEEWGPDLGLSIGAPILERSLFELPARGTLNIHGGKVPEFRGAPPGFWEVWAGASEVGATLHWMTEQLNAGEVVDEAVAPIYPRDSLRRVEERIEELSVRVMERGLRAVLEGQDRARPQEPSEHANRSPRIASRIRLEASVCLRRVRRWFESGRGPVKAVLHWLLIYLFRPVRDLWRTLRGRHPVRVFTFHRVTTLLRDGMTVSPRVFRDQLAHLSATHRVLPASTALSLVRSGAPLRRPVAVITFDDGYRSVLERAFPLMQAEGVVGTCFLSTRYSGTSRRFDHDAEESVRPFLDVMEWPEVQLLAEAGWEMGGHTRNHRRVSELEGDELHSEVAGPASDLAEVLGSPPATFAYPFGLEEDISPEAVAVAEATGYGAAFQDYGGDIPRDPSWYRLPRTELGGDHPSLAWKARIHGLSLRSLARPVLDRGAGSSMHGGAP